MFLFIKTKYLCYSLFNLGIETFFLCLNRLLIRQKKYLVLLAIVISFVLSSALGILSILGVGDNYTIIRLTIKINRLLTASI
jgi:hypothetical protein